MLFRLLRGFVSLINKIGSKIFFFIIVNFSYATSLSFHNVIVSFQNLLYGTTYAALSFWAILDQVLEKLDVTYMGGETFFIRGLKFQANILH